MLDIHSIRASIRIEDLIAFYSGRPLYQTGSAQRLRYHCFLKSHTPDDNPSGAIDRVKQLAYCFGCQQGFDAIGAVSRQRGGSPRESVRWLADHRWQIPPATILPLVGLQGHRSSNTERKPRGRSAVYRYRDARGGERYQILRTPDKQFLFRHLGPDGEWIWNGEGVARILYQLNAIQKLPFCFVVEGEKDCNTLWRHELPAVTNPGGAGKWCDRYTRQLTTAGVRHVVALPDNDEPGRAHARLVWRSCRAFDLDARIIRLPDLPPKGDITDWFEAGHCRGDLVRLVRQEFA
jgi:DNA primase